MKILEIKIEGQLKEMNSEIDNFLPKFISINSKSKTVGTQEAIEIINISKKILKLPFRQQSSTQQ